MFRWGTEEGLIGAALTPEFRIFCWPIGTSRRSTIIASISPAAAGKDEEEYLHLRLDADLREWRELAQQRGIPRESRKCSITHTIGRSGKIIREEIDSNRPRISILSFSQGATICVMKRYQQAQDAATCGRWRRLT